MEIGRVPVVEFLIQSAEVTSFALSLFHILIFLLSNPVSVIAMVAPPCFPHC